LQRGDEATKTGAALSPFGGDRQFRLAAHRIEQITKAHGNLRKRK
jgi:hypothetical protein